MTTTVALRPGRGLLAEHDPGRLVVPVAVVLTIVSRLPFLGKPPGADEAGYLLVGQQWHAGGSSLYGSYWVDRPPLLISIFKLAADLGGVVPLRIIGCVAAVLVVCGSALVAGQVAGRRAERWAAVAAAIFLLSPLLGGIEINGELLAAPFILGGMAAVLASLNGSRIQPVWTAALAGGCLVCGLMIKQNMADVAVFAVVSVAMARGQRRASSTALRRLVRGFAVGALLTLGATALWTLAHGTSLQGVYEAMYPFRLDAGHVMASSSRVGDHRRLVALVVSAVGSGLAVVIALAAGALAVRRLRDAAVWALGATVVFDLVSVALGGSYWSHYLVQLIAPVSVLAGVLLARRVPGTRGVVAVSAVTAAVAWAVAVSVSQASVGGAVGAALRASARPGDTLVTMYGHAEVAQASGLPSPYPYLWWLPAKTLDPQLSRLDSVLNGPSAPTWLVSWKGFATWGADGPNVHGDLVQNYRPVAHLCGRAVYLRDGVDRSPPRLAAPCPDVRPISTAIKEHLS